MESEMTGGIFALIVSVCLIAFVVIGYKMGWIK